MTNDSKSKASGFVYTEMKPSHHSEAYQLWSTSEGIGLNDRDGYQEIAFYLSENPDLSQVVIHKDKVIGTLLAGSDGRRGYLHHLVIDKTYRKCGLARELVTRSIRKLHKIGIDKSHIFVYANNQTGIAFWSALGWTFREELRIMSYQWKK